jgi:hypothetical protein
MIDEILRWADTVHMDKKGGSLQDGLGYMVVMQCIWRPGTGVSELGLRVGGWDGYTYIYSSCSSVQTTIKALCIHTAESSRAEDPNTRYYISLDSPYPFFK